MPWVLTVSISGDQSGLVVPVVRLCSSLVEGTLNMEVVLPLLELCWWPTVASEVFASVTVCDRALPQHATPDLLLQCTSDVLSQHGNRTLVACPRRVCETEAQMWRCCGV